MVLDKFSIEEKLRRLREIISFLEEYRKVPKEDFIRDHTINGAARHYLVLGIEIIVDIGNHLLSEVFQVKTTEYAEIIEKLGKVKIVPEKFAKENIDMARFRNLLIHEYTKVDLEKVYQNLQKAPDIFREFAKYFQEFLEKI